MFSNNGQQQQQQHQQFQHGGSGGSAPSTNGQSDWFSGSGNSNNMPSSHSNGPMNSSYNPNFNSVPLSSSSSSSIGGAMTGGPIGGGGIQGGPMGGGGPDYEDEPPLLEELGVNIDHIIAKTKAVMNPARIDEHLMDDTDMAGPLVFGLILGVSLMLTGKLHFGYIYGFGVFGCLAISTIVNLMSKEEVETWRVFSILGYCLLPVNILAVLAIVVNLQGPFGMFLSLLTIGWCTFASTRLFDRCINMRQQRYLIAYPVALLYSCFTLFTVF